MGGGLVRKVVEIFAIARRWVVPGVDRTYSDIEHYVLDVEIPEVANFFKSTQVAF